MVLIIAFPAASEINGFFSANVNHLCLRFAFDRRNGNIVYCISGWGENKQGKMIVAHLCLINRSFSGLAVEVLLNHLL